MTPRNHPLCPFRDSLGSCPHSLSTRKSFGSVDLAAPPAFFENRHKQSLRSGHACSLATVLSGFLDKWNLDKGIFLGGQRTFHLFLLRDFVVLARLRSDLRPLLADRLDAPREVGDGREKATRGPTIHPSLGGCSRPFSFFSGFLFSSFFFEFWRGTPPPIHRTCLCLLIRSQDYSVVNGPK